MDHGQPPDQKRQRVGSWSSSLSQERPQLERPHLPLPPPARQYPQEGNSPFNGPENPLNPRRHSDQQTQYEPDPRRPNSGPHTGPPHGYLSHHPHSAPPYAQPSVVTMKRDPAEEQAQQYRPPSRGNGAEHNVGTPHSYGPPLPPFDNHSAPPGAIPFRPPGGYATTPHSPMTANEPYSGYGPPHQSQRGDVFSSVSYPQQVAAVKRKAQRAAQACDSCRNLKAKCDEGRPSCLSCKDKNIPCNYRDPPPKQQDKTQADILEGMMEMKSLFMNHMTSITGLVKSLNGKVDRIENELKIRDVSSPTINSSLKQDEGQDPPLQHVPQYSEPSAGTISHQQEVSESPHPSPSTPEMAVGDVNQPEEAGPPVNPGPSSIPINHTTGAARLLLVPPIHELAAGANPYRHVPESKRPSIEQYPMLIEDRRGLMRVYGRGQGIDRPTGYEKEQMIDYPPSEGTPSDTASDPSTPPGEEWGQIGGLTPPPEDTVISRVGADPRMGLGISPEGLPDLSRETIKLLANSYLLNINIMHPIIIPARMWSLVETFLKTVPDSQVKHEQHPPERIVAGFTGSRSIESPGAKRKRSPIVTTEGYEVHGVVSHKAGHPFRSISTAIVLLVMALGSICLHKEKIPELVSDKDVDDDGSSPASRNGSIRSPLQTHSAIPNATGLPSPQEADRAQPRSRRASLDGHHIRSGSNLKLKNLDVIPGLSYFAVATDILGNQLGGNSLQHVHAHILAGLYQGQLGRVMESYAYIGNACRALQVILNPKLDRFKRLKDQNEVIPHRDNPLVFAFWTCLQLESDILAELHVPVSGILTYEENMPTPNVRAAVEFDHFDLIHIESYMTQLHLRKHLNQLHTMFYKPEESDESQTSKTSHFRTIEAVEANLESIKESLVKMNWDENDKPAKDILGARLRAKYYGAKVITYRSFVLRILINSAEKSPKMQSRQVKSIINEYKFGIIDPEIDNSGTRKEEPDPKYLELAERGINALIKSTTAFHGLGDPGISRLIVTNVWGTAHAQWGNVLTLLAAYNDPTLKRYIDEKILQSLLKKTLAFLEMNMHDGSALHVDYSILKHVGRLLKLLPPKKSKNPQPLSASSSFASNHGADVPMSGY